MLPVVDIKSPKTIAFFKCVLGVLLNSDKHGEENAVQIKFIEDTPLFPALKEVPISSGDIYDIIPESFHKNERLFLATQAIKSYLLEALAGSYSASLLDWNEQYPLVLTFTFIKQKPEILNIITKKYGVRRSIKSINPLEKLMRPPKTIPKIYYDPNSGLGFMNDKKFRLKKDQPEFKVFAELYANMGQNVSRKNILEKMGHEETSNILSKYSATNNHLKNVSRKYATMLINELVKKIRQMTGLTTEQLVMNNGSLTLRGGIYENPPI